MRNPNSVTLYPKQDDEGEACWDLPATRAAVRTARRLVREALTAWNLSNLADCMTVVVSEVVTNAVVHAKSRMTLSLHRQGRIVRGEVADESAAWPTPLTTGPDEENGRGLAIVAAYSERWGVDPSPNGKIVWFVCEDVQAPASTCRTALSTCVGEPGLLLTHSSPSLSGEALPQHGGG